MIENSLGGDSKSSNSNNKSKVTTHFHIIHLCNVFSKNTKEFESKLKQPATSNLSPGRKGKKNLGDTSWRGIKNSTSFGPILWKDYILINKDIIGKFYYLNRIKPIL